MNPVCLEISWDFTTNFTRLTFKSDPSNKAQKWRRMKSVGKLYFLSNLLIEYFQQLLWGYSKNNFVPFTGPVIIMILNLYNIINFFFLVSALLRDCSLCWDRWRHTWLLHLTWPCYYMLRDIALDGCNGCVWKACRARHTSQQLGSNLPLVISCRDSGNDFHFPDIASYNIFPFPSPLFLSQVGHSCQIVTPFSLEKNLVHASWCHDSMVL